MSVQYDVNAIVAGNAGNFSRKLSREPELGRIDIFLLTFLCLRNDHRSDCPDILKLIESNKLSC